jgi:hypothetical protein
MIRYKETLLSSLIRFMNHNQARWPPNFSKSYPVRFIRAMPQERLLWLIRKSSFYKQLSHRINLFDEEFHLQPKWLCRVGGGLQRGFDVNHER